MRSLMMMKTKRTLRMSQGVVLSMSMTSVKEMKDQREKKRSQPRSPPSMIKVKPIKFN